ncbi:unnamed protein product [Vicia faba]|uniref:Uncharacterized protein n=1 Tax=Vicia faba TaxID=3906 RepID=A0AAV1BBC1_VICFA|nr:unnamed protein product [Vicia faba]
MDPRCIIQQFNMCVTAVEASAPEISIVKLHGLVSGLIRGAQCSAFFLTISDHLRSTNAIVSSLLLDGIPLTLNHSSSLLCSSPSPLTPQGCFCVNCYGYKALGTWSYWQSMVHGYEGKAWFMVIKAKHGSWLQMSEDSKHVMKMKMNSA